MQRHMLIYCNVLFVAALYIIPKVKKPKQKKINLKNQVVLIHVSRVCSAEVISWDIQVIAQSENSD